MVTFGKTTAAVIASSKGVMRQSQVLDQAGASPGTVREEIDELVLNGKIKRFPVGEHIMIKVCEGESLDIETPKKVPAPRFPQEVPAPSSYPEA